MIIEIAFGVCINALVPVEEDKARCSEKIMDMPLMTSTHQCMLFGQQPIAEMFAKLNKEVLVTVDDEQKIVPLLVMERGFDCRWKDESEMDL